MKKTGAYLTVYALEQIGVKQTFGIPGTHTTELYDELNNSKLIEPVLVTHEGGGAFMADGVSRTSGQVGTLTIVPAAGATHAMSGIAEAFLDGLPMLVISGGTRRDTGRHYQLHQIDLEKVAGGVVKAYHLVERHEDIVSTIYQAYDQALSGEPGPVFVEIPVELLLFKGKVRKLMTYQSSRAVPAPSPEAVKAAADLLLAAENPGIYVGWGAVDAVAEVEALAERLVAPAATTLQGKSAFPAHHPLHVGVGFGPTGLPAAQEAFKDCDCLLAVGCRFAEIATGSYGVKVPDNLIHVDINPDVFNKNFPARVTIEGDAGQVLRALNEELAQRNWSPVRKLEVLAAKIADQKRLYGATWLGKKKDNIVSPGFFFKALREKLPDDAFLVVDDGKHTFLAAELFDVYEPRHFISPTDFNCMGYCVPAAIGAKMVNPDKVVAAVVGDGAFLMTGMETITAVTYGLGIPIFVFHDGELGQISQFQQISLNRKTATVLGDMRVEGVAMATGAEFLAMKNDLEIEGCIDRALALAGEGKPVIVDVNIDYSKRTMLTKGVVKTNLSRFPLREKVRFIRRAIKRKILG
jgi:acetolactate synthase-1/2/3 large subunit